MEYLRPGVYTERVDAAAPGISVIRTDVAAFIGIARAGPLDTPVPVQSFRQFQAHFGEFTGQGFLAYAVHAFFQNGGRRCWVIRVASKEAGVGAATAAVTLDDSSGPVWKIEAANPGSWGNQLTVALQSERSAQAVLDPGRSRPRFGAASSVTGFERGTLARLSQSDGGGAVVERLRVVSFVDAPAGLLYWVHPDPGDGLPYDAPLEGLDRGLPITVESLSYRLLVYRDGRLWSHFGGLSLIPEHPRYGPAVLRPAEYPTRLGESDRLPSASPPVVIRELRDDTSVVPQPLDRTEGARTALEGGSDGLKALGVGDFVGEPVSPSDSDAVKAEKRRGIEALDLVDEIGIVAVPDIVVRPEPSPVFEPQPPEPTNPCLDCPPPPEPRQPFTPAARNLELPPQFDDDQIFQAQAALVEHCERRGDRFGLLDPPWNAARDDSGGVGAIQAWRARFDSSYAALYYPWLKVIEPRRTSPVREIPPSGHVAGQFAAHDLEVGVHRAAANRSLVWSQDVTVAVSDGQHEVLNPRGINVIRSEPGRAVRIMGARTLSVDPDWRYVNVRRLLLMIRKAVDVSTQWAVFEPNDVTTRNKLFVALSSFLSALWQRGALVGATAEQAFFVKCDEENNPPEQRRNGRMLAQVGVSPSRPYEFVLLRIGFQGNELEVSEAGFLAATA